MKVSLIVWVDDAAEIVSAVVLFGHAHPATLVNGTAVPIALVRTSRAIVNLRIRSRRFSIVTNSLEVHFTGPVVATIDLAPNSIAKSCDRAVDEP